MGWRVSDGEANMYDPVTTQSKSVMASFKLFSRFYDLEGAVYHGGAIAYALLGYAAGFAGLFADSLLINGFATLLLSHAMIIAGYLIHEAGHNTVFRTNQDNARLGAFLSHLCGSSYGTFEDMRFKHFRHHVDIGDFAWFDSDGWFARHPIVLKGIRVLEWYYVPAHEFIMHGVMLLTSFVIPERRDQRLRNVAVIIMRGGLFLLLLIYAPKVALLYFVAYSLMLIVFRFMDAVQHDYGSTPTLFDKAPGPRKGDLVWEQAHSFSNPLSLEFEKLNWLVLNFGFHNAHHAKPTTPWFRLPALHREMFADNPNAVIAFSAQLKIYHTGRVYRVARLADAPDEPVGPAFLEAAQLARISGGNAANFLTSF